MAAHRKRYKVYRVEGDRSWLVDDFPTREAAGYVHKTVPNFLTHIRNFGNCEGNGHKAIPYEDRDILKSGASAQPRHQHGRDVERSNVSQCDTRKHTDEPQDHTDRDCDATEIRNYGLPVH